MPPSAAEELTSISQILHLTHHRNKNQHRLSKWYKSLSQLRRQISKLLLEIKELDTAVTFSSKQGKENRYVKAVREKVEIRVIFWEERLLERWYIAFSNLTADNQYATLGLMLLGCLARLKRVVTPFGKDLKGEDEDMVEGGSVVKLEIMGGIGDDFGEVVKREELERSRKEPKAQKEQAEDEGDSPPLRNQKQKKRKSTGPERTSIDKAVESAPSRRPKKKQKKGDSFDDIFSSLM